jgi:hypothetical protein
MPVEEKGHSTSKTPTGVHQSSRLFLNSSFIFYPTHLNNMFLMLEVLHQRMELPHISKMI